VQQQKRYLVKKLHLRLGGIAGSGIGADHHIAEQVWADTGTLPLLLGEGDYIGGLIAL